MAKTIEFTYEDKDYVLEFTKRTVKQMESTGFSLDKLADKPMTYLPELFKGAFLVHHKEVKQEKIAEIYSHLTDKEALIGKLMEIYNDPINAMMEEPTEEEKKVNWKANF